MAYRTMKLVNLVIGAICFGLEMYAYANTVNELLTDVDSFLVIIAAFCLVESVFGILLCNKEGDCCCFTLWKYCWFILLVFMGGALIIETYGFSDGGVPSCTTHTRSYTKRGHIGCQYFEMKVAAGIFFALNGMVYLFLRPDLDRDRTATVPSSYRLPTPVVPARPQRRANGISTTTVISGPNTTTTIIMPPRNVSQAPPPPPHGPRNIGRRTGFRLHPRPLPSLPTEAYEVQSPFAPSAPPPGYFDSPPPYSTLPPNTQPPRSDGEFCI